MRYYARYLFLQYFSSTGFLTLALVGAIWLTQSLRYIDFVMARGLSIGTYLKLVSFLLPNLFSLVLPFSFFIGLLFVLNRFYNDRELIVLQAVGLSNYDLAKPVMVLAVLVWAVVSALNLYIYPLANQSYRSSKNEIMNNLTSALLHPGEFTSFKNMTFYVKEKQPGGKMKGLFVYDQRVPDKPVSIMAENAAAFEEDGGLKLVLMNGNRQELDRNSQPHMVSFEVYTIEIANRSLEPETTSKPSEYFIHDLFAPPANLHPKLQQKLRFEGHQRILLPLMVFPLAFLALAVFLLGEFNRRGRYKKISIALAGAIALEGAIILSLNMGRDLYFFLSLSYAILGGITLCLAMLVLNRPSLAARFKEGAL